MHIAQVKRDAWLEYRVARQVSTGNGEHYCAQWRIPGWFVSVELGLGVCEGPSILYTMAHLPDLNRRNRKMLAEQEGVSLRSVRTKPRQKRMSATECAVRLRRKAMQMAAAG